MILSVSGYNHKLPIHLERIVKAMRDLKIDPERFVLVKEQVQRWYRNALLEAPSNHAIYYVSYLTQEKMWVYEAKIAVLDDITVDDVQSFVSQLLSELHIEALIHGNVLEDDAIRMVETVENLLKPRALVPAQLMGHRSVLLPSNGRFVYQRDVHDPNNVNSAIEYYIQIGNLMDTGARARTGLLAQIASESAFDQLRTKEQLGMRKRRAG
jgi:insulysin